VTYKLLERGLEIVGNLFTMYPLEVTVYIYKMRKKKYFNRAHIKVQIQNDPSYNYPLKACTSMYIWFSVTNDPVLSNNDI
jgi:hypothetical protein